MKPLFVIKRVAHYFWLLALIGLGLFVYQTIIFPSSFINPAEIPGTTRYLILFLIGLKIVVDLLVLGGTLTGQDRGLIKKVQTRIVVTPALLLLIIAPLMFDQYYASLIQGVFFSLMSLLIGTLFMLASTLLWEKIF